MNKTVKDYSSIEQSNFQEKLHEAVSGNDTDMMGHLFKNFHIYSTSLHELANLAITSQRCEALDFILARSRWDSTYIDNAALFETAKSGGYDIWKTILNHNNCSRQAHWQIKESTIERIAQSEGASEVVRLYARYDLLDKDSLKEKPLQHSGELIKLTHIFNFHSCQQTTIVHCEDKMSASTAGFDALSKRAFFEEKYAVYQKLGGSAPSPFNINKFAAKNIRLD